MGINKQNQFVFYIVKAPRIKDLLIIDGMIGTVLYYTFKQSTSSEIIGFIASMVGVTGIKKTAFFKR